jgi:hypothetical protein
MQEQLPWTLNNKYKSHTIDAMYIVLHSRREYLALNGFLPRVGVLITKVYAWNFLPECTCALLTL